MSARRKRNATLIRAVTRTASRAARGKKKKRTRTLIAAAGALATAGAIAYSSGGGAALDAALPGVHIPTPREQPVDNSITTQAGSQGDSAYFANALATLDTLAIKGRAPKTGYSRDEFGPAWSDDVTVEGGHSGCDTRNDQLSRELSDKTFKPGTRDCVVLSGQLYDPYSGNVLQFQRGRDTSSLIQVDHVVPLMDSWQKGSQTWDADKRRNFANDPINLQLTTGSLNASKGSSDAATWLPPNKSYRCTYVSRIVDVKSKYGLWVTQAEHDAIANILTKCVAGNTGN